MNDFITIEPIAVKNKREVVKALKILEKIGVKIMTDKEKKNYVADKTKNVHHNFMIQEEDGGFRIQSHYIGFGISLKSLEKQVNEIINTYPDIVKQLREIGIAKDNLAQQIKVLTTIDIKIKEDKK